MRLSRPERTSTEGAAVLAEMRKHVTAAAGEVRFTDLCAYGTPLEIDAAIKAGADVNDKNGLGYTALMVAARHNDDHEVFNALIKAGADVNAKESFNNTALLFAATEKNAEVVNVLINAGADVSARNNNGHTVLMVAISLNKNPDVTFALINAGADVNAKDFSGMTALMMAISLNKGPEVLNALIKAGAVVTKYDVELAQQNDHLRGVKNIVELKQRVNNNLEEV